MKHKKALALLLAASMCFSMGACGSSNEEQKDSVDSKTDDTEKTSNDGEQADATTNYWDMLDDVADSSDLPDWTGEILEVTTWSAFGTDMVIPEVTDDNVTLKEIERVTGVRFNMEDSFGNKGDNVDAVVPKLVASDSFPTMFYRLEFNDITQELYDNGYLVDLTEYYENGYLDEVLERIPQEYFDESIYSRLRTEDGKYFALPYSDNVVNYYSSVGYSPEGFDADYYNTYGQSPVSGSNVLTNFTIWVRDDVLQALYPDSLTMEEITQIYMENGEFTEEQIFDLGLESSEDLWNLLRDIQELLDSSEFTSLSGQEIEVTYGPNTELDAWQLMSTLPKAVNGWGEGTNYFTVLDRTATDESSLIKRAIDTDQYKDWMQTLNTFVNEDIISQNSFVDNSATFNEKIMNGYYAVVYGGSLPVFYPSEIDGSEGGWSYRPIWINQPIDDSFGCNTGEPNLYYNGIFKGDLTDEQIEQLVHCINYLNSEIGISCLQNGPRSAGLFTEDADGNRTYTEKGLEVINDTELYESYGLWTSSLCIPHVCQPCELYSLKYINASTEERYEERAYMYYNPGLLEGRSLAENSDVLKTDAYIYSSGLVLDSVSNFWSARAGYEDQVKKVITASADNFENEYNNLIQYANDNYLTEETVQEFNDWFVENNREELKAAGIIE